MTEEEKKEGRGEGQTKGWRRKVERVMGGIGRGGRLAGKKYEL